MAEPVTFEGLCRVPGCPAPSDPDWHHCFVCGNPQGDHAHVESRAREPGKKHSPDNIVFLCRRHHDMVDKTHECGHAIEEFPDHMLHYLYWKSGLVRKDLADRVVGEVGGSGHMAPYGLGLQHKTMGSEQVPAYLSDHPRVVKGEVLDDPFGEIVGKTYLSIEYDQSSDHPPDTPESPVEPADGLPAVVGGESHWEAKLRDIIPPEEELPKVSYERHALVIDGPLSWERYCELVGKLETAGRALNWWVGDAILAGEAAFGEEAYQPWEAEGHKVVWLQQCAWVASRFPLHTRVNLAWTYFRIVAALSEPLRSNWLNRALSEGMSTRQLREAIAPACECECEQSEDRRHHWGPCIYCGKER